MAIQLPSPLSQQLNINNPCELIRTIDAEIDAQNRDYIHLIELASRHDEELQPALARIGMVVGGTIGGATGYVESRCVVWLIEKVFSTTLPGQLVTVGTILLTIYKAKTGADNLSEIARQQTPYTLRALNAINNNEMNLVEQRVARIMARTIEVSSEIGRLQGANPGPLQQQLQESNSEQTQLFSALEHYGNQIHQVFENIQIANMQAEVG